MPRVLVISNNCFSRSDSNGRTLGVLFDGYPREKIAQFYIQGARPDFAFCDNHFRVTDGQAFRSLMLRRPGNCVIRREDAANAENAPISPSTGGEKRHKRTPLTMIARNFVWNVGLWRTAEYKKWIDSFDPELILLQAGDCSFMIKIALREAKKRRIPLVVFNTEGYYFKDFDYFRSSGFAHLLYRPFISAFRRQMKRLFKYSSHFIYSTNELKRAYGEVCDKPASVIYTATDIAVESRAVPAPSGEAIRSSYLGNLGIGRHLGLIEIARALAEADPRARLDVYGKIPSDAVREDLENCSAVNYRGVVTYDEVKRILRESDLIVHTESFEAFYREDLKFAFSTKIADSLACGTGFFVYAPPELSCVKYLREYGAAHVACDRDEMREIFERIVADPDERVKYVPSAQKLALEMHNSKRNQELFRSILAGVFSDTDNG